MPIPSHFLKVELHNPHGIAIAKREVFNNEPVCVNLSFAVSQKNMRDLPDRAEDAKKGE